jgi:molybdate/tungstate transport system substrate-binding protein
MGMKSAWILAIFILLTVITTQISCTNEKSNKIQLKVHNADSLIIPFQKIERNFETKYPEIDVIIEGHGSIQVIRAVTELGDDVDVAAVADSQLIRLLMYDTPMKEKNGTYADWCIDFATNSLGIAYTDKSKYAGDISAGNWYKIMSRPDVNIGLSDPRIDSLGYRTLMAMQLAQTYYQNDVLIEQMIGGAFETKLNFSNLNGLTTITVPEILKPAQNRIVLRTYSLQILALLESGDVDYSFEYESVTRQHGFHFLRLPEEIDLSSQGYADIYKKVRIAMDFQRFASVNPVFPGVPIVYVFRIMPNTRWKRLCLYSIYWVLKAEKSWP